VGVVIVGWLGWDGGYPVGEGWGLGVDQPGVLLLWYCATNRAPPRHTIPATNTTAQLLPLHFPFRLLAGRQDLVAEIGVDNTVWSSTYFCVDRVDRAIRLRFGCGQVGKGTQCISLLGVAEAAAPGSVERRPP
jgi:hypothetical protein